LLEQADSLRKPQGNDSDDVVSFIVSFIASFIVSLQLSAKCSQLHPMGYEKCKISENRTQSGVANPLHHLQRLLQLMQ